MPNDSSLQNKAIGAVKNVYDAINSTNTTTVALVPRASTDGNIFEVANRFLGGGNIIFRVRPTITENRSTTYVNEGLPLAPSALVIYGATESRTFTITGKFVSRTVEEAFENWTYIQLIKSYSIPDDDLLGSGDFAKQNQTQDNSYADIFGSADTGENPRSASGTGSISSVLDYGPTILQLRGYGSFNNIPTVLQSYSIEYTDDVDYIKFENNGKVFDQPIFVTVTLTLLETQIADIIGEGNGFNMTAFRTGSLRGY